MHSARTRFRTIYLSKLLPISCCLSLALVGCSNTSGTAAFDGPSPTNTTSQVSPTAQITSAEATPEEVLSANAIAAYMEILANPSSYSISDAAQYVPNGTYSYAVVEATSDSIPELLLRVNSAEYSPVLVFTYDDDTKTAVQAEGAFIDGASGAGGARSRIRASNSGVGIYQVDWNSLREIAQNTLYGIQDNTLTKVSGPEEFVFANSMPDHHEISWISVSDKTGLFTIQRGGTSITPTPPTSTQAPAANLHHFSGMVTMQTADELMKGEPTPNGEPATDLHLVLVLDSPIEITARKAGSASQTSTISEVSLGQYIPTNGDNEWLNFLNTNVEITANADQVWFPTDTGLPLGMLRLQDYVSLRTR